MNIVKQVLTVAAVMLFMALSVDSAKPVPARTFALIQKRNGEVLYDKVYEDNTGRHHIGRRNKFLPFRKTYRRVEIYGLDIFSSDNSEFNINCIGHYRITKDSVPMLYSRFLYNFHDHIVTTIRTTIKNTAPMFTINEYITNKTQIERTFLDKINSEMNVNYGFGIEEHDFVLNNIDFPSGFNNRNREVVINQLETARLELSRTNNLIIEETDRLLAEINNEIDFITANTSVTTEYILEDARQKAANLVVQANSDGIDYFFQTLNVTNNSDKIELFNPLRNRQKL